MRQHLLENGGVNSGIFPTTPSKGAAEEEEQEQQEEGTGRSSCRGSESQLSSTDTPSLHHPVWMSSNILCPSLSLLSLSFSRSAVGLGSYPAPLLSQELISE